MSFISFSCHITLTRTSTVMLNKSGIKVVSEDIFELLLILGGEHTACHTIQYDVNFFFSL